MIRALLIAVGLLLSVPSVARAEPPFALASYVQAGVRLEAQQQTVVLRAPGVDEPLVISADPSVPAHIRTEVRFRRGGNPYRVWLATPRLWAGDEIPRSRWGRFLKAPFLTVLRAPPQDVRR